MDKKVRHAILLSVLITCTGIILCAAKARAAQDTKTSVVGEHPEAVVLEKVFGEKEVNNFGLTGIRREDYLKLAAANIDYFKKCQREDGAILDPFENFEVQYSTPSFALAAATLVKEWGRKDLLEPACLAESCALTALVNHHAANQHSDFYIPLLVHAYEVLKGFAPPDRVTKWEGQFKSILPEKTYRMDLRGMNWNIVSSCGELLRRKDGLVAPEQIAPQWKYLEESLQGHVKDITKWGLVEDPGAPLTYDAFSRMWIDEMMADGAYDGKLAATFTEAMRDGALSALLLTSPSGEWANGGRSGMHNWTEAENLLICEIEANRWKKLGRGDIAGAFKREAHLALQSLQRWQRPTGELWIIKNRAEPTERLAFEPYSYHAQYNLLPMAMLSMAYEHADDSIIERPTPSEVGGYVFDVRERFHKIAAAAGGYFVLIDSDADPHYNATGLQRIHREGVAFPSLSDSAAAERAFGPKGGDKQSLTPGLAWKNSDAADSPWHSLSDFSEHGLLTVKSVDLRSNETTPSKVAFDVDYALAGLHEDGRHVVEHYSITSGGVECTSELIAKECPVAFRAQFPVLVSDGSKDLALTSAPDSISIENHGSVTKWKVLSPLPDARVELSGPRLVTHNGYVQLASIPLQTNRVCYQVTLSSSEAVQQ